MKSLLKPARLMAVATVFVLAGCVTAETPNSQRVVEAVDQTTAEEKFRQDREAILAMAGNYRVSFDFIETVSFVDGYDIKDRKLSGGDEIVRVIEDRGDFISLQHILVVGGEKKFPVKHWRQDWRYEPSSVLTFVGGNAWEKRQVAPGNSKGKWSQVVYQVDDAPRYGALGEWSHEDGISEWTPPSAWRPLPRRDATTRNDYQAVDAVNRHAITPDGWVHEQDNSKLILKGERQVLVREIAINTYKEFDDFETSVGDDYWNATKDYWASVRSKWNEVEAASESFGLTIQGEPEELYMQLLQLADEVKGEEKPLSAATAEASRIIDEYTTSDVGSLATRLNATEQSTAAQAQGSDNQSGDVTLAQKEQR